MLPLLQVYYIHKWVEVQALFDKEYYCVSYLLHRQCYNYMYMDARFKEKGIGLNPMWWSGFVSVRVWCFT